MYTKAKVLKIEDSLVVALPAEVVDILKVKEGDEIIFTKASEGGAVQLDSEVTDLGQKMAIVKRAMEKYHDALVQLKD